MLTSILKFLSNTQVYGTLLVVVLTYISYKVISYFLNKVDVKFKDELERKRGNTLVFLIKNIVKYILIIIMILVLLNLYGVNTASVIAGLGVAGIVIGFALQEALKDIIGGFSIIFDNYFVVGDVVKYEDFSGTVTELGLRSTKIKKHTGEVLIIANRNIDKIINISQERANVVIKIPTAYEEKVEKVEKVLKEVVEKIKGLYDEVDEANYLGLDSFETSYVLYTVIFKCKRGTQWELKRKALKEIKEAYEKNKIKIPYTQLEVRNGNKI